MSDILKVLQAGDLAGLEMEKARAVVDAARLALEDARAKFEFAKQAFDDVAESAEEAGVAKAKFKKMIEERTAILWNSGIAGNLEANDSPNQGLPNASPTILEREQKPFMPADAEEPPVNHLLYAALRNGEDAAMCCDQPFPAVECGIGDAHRVVFIGCQGKGVANVAFRGDLDRIGHAALVRNSTASSIDEPANRHRRRGAR